MRMSGLPHDPIIINDQRYLNVWQAAHIVETIREQTLYRWAKHGTTPFGFELGIIRQPVTNHRNLKSDEPPPKQPRASRMLIPEEKVYALKEILRDDPIRPGPLSKTDMAALEAAARRFRSPQPLAKHLTNS
jgi:hypothetical protein